MEREANHIGFCIADKANKGRLQVVNMEGEEGSILQDSEGLAN